MDIMSDIRLLEGCLIAYLASQLSHLLPTECELAGV